MAGPVLPFAPSLAALAAMTDLEHRLGPVIASSCAAWWQQQQAAALAATFAATPSGP